MKRSELKTGMKIVMNDGDVAVVLRGTEDGDVVSGETFFPVNCFDKNLSNRGKYGIEAVYAEPEGSRYILYEGVSSLRGYTKIWPTNHTVSFDGLERAISDESFDALKNVFQELD